MLRLSARQVAMIPADQLSSILANAKRYNLSHGSIEKLCRRYNYYHGWGRRQVSRHAIQRRQYVRCLASI